jgi:anti-anti-sigma factor
MRVFLSWSGGDSQRAAEALKPWLQRLLPGVEVWMSTHDIEAGTPWATVLHQRLRQADFGLLCLTDENLTAPWILYEAGALAMSSKVGCVVPLLLDVAPEKLPAPLAQFQGVRADAEGVWKILRSLNNAGGGGLEEERLREAFEKEWPSLAGSLGLDIKTSLRAGVLVVTPGSPQLLQEQQIQPLKDKVKELLRMGHKKIVLDFNEVRHFTSAALGVLLLGGKQGADVVVVGSPPPLLQLLEQTKLSRIVRHFPALDDAFAYFDQATDNAVPIGSAPRPGDG